jgi:hypothetical protein
MLKTNISHFSAHYKHQKRLAAGLRPDPLGELTALPQTPADSRGPLRGRGGTRDGEKGWKGSNTDPPPPAEQKTTAHDDHTATDSNMFK